MTVMLFPKKNPSTEQAQERALLAAEAQFLQALQDFAKLNPIMASERLGDHVAACCRVVRSAIQGNSHG